MDKENEYIAAEMQKLAREMQATRPIRDIYKFRDDLEKRLISLGKHLGNEISVSDSGMFGDFGPGYRKNVYETLYALEKAVEEAEENINKVLHQWWEY